MKDTTLKSLSEAWKIYFKQPIKHKFVIDRYDKFIDFVLQLLELWMFIPCKDEVPLEEPKDFKVFLKWKKDRDVFSKAYLKEFDEYQQALDRVIFKGFRVVSNKNGSIRIENNEIYLEFYGKVVNWFGGKIKSIQDLTVKVQLTNKQHELLNL